MTETPDTTHVDTHALEVETLRTVILGSLTELAGLLDMTAELVHGHQHGLGFLTAEGRKILDDLTRRERLDRVRHAQDGVQVTGESPAPGNIKAWATNSEIHLALAGIHHELITRLHRAGVCLTWRTPADPDPVLLMARIGILAVHAKSPDVLNHVDRELQALVGQAKRLAHGDDKKRHPDPCPHCDRQSLVIYFDDRVIRCEQDPHTGEYERCICRDAYCPCKHRNHRHEWYADETRAKSTRGARTWWQLSDDLNRLRRAKHDKETQS